MYDSRLFLPGMDTHLLLSLLKRKKRHVKIITQKKLWHKTNNTNIDLFAESPMHQVSKNPPRNGYLAYSAVTPQPRSAVSSTGRAGRHSNSFPRWGRCRNNPRPPREGKEWKAPFSEKEEGQEKNECKYDEHFEAQSELSQGSVRAQSELQSELSRSL